MRLEEIEPLLLGQIAHGRGGCGRTACDIPRQRALKDIRGVESREIEYVIQVAAVPRKYTRGIAASFNQRRSGAVEGVCEEPECEARVVIKNSVAPANHRFSIAPGLPTNTDAPLHVLVV